MISNNCNNLSVDGDTPKKRTVHITSCATRMLRCTLHFFRGIPPSAENLFLNDQLVTTGGDYGFVLCQPVCQSDFLSFSLFLTHHFLTFPGYDFRYLAER